MSGVAPQCFSCTQREQGCGDHFGLPITAASFCEGTCKKMRGERYCECHFLLFGARRPDRLADGQGGREKGEKNSERLNRDIVCLLFA